jgi:predicted dehydrogenase
MMGALHVDKIRWGILSTARIATETVIPAIQAGGTRGYILAIASRDQKTAEAAAARLGIPRAYGSYEELLADPDIDAVYNPLPNHLHVPWSVRALEAGKHILCEKPLARNVAEAMILVEAGRRHPELKVMEAFMYKFHPQWHKVRSLVEDGAIGELRTVSTVFAYYEDNADNIRNTADVGGGGLLDIGCYAISVPRYLFAAEPARLVATLEFDPRFQTDRLDSAILAFGRGTATFTCSTQLDHYQRVTVHGTGGSIEVEIPFNAPTDRPCKLFYRHGGELEEILLDTCNQYALQADAFAQAILWNEPEPVPLYDAVANMKVIEAAFASAKAGTWITLG